MNSIISIDDGRPARGACEVSTRVADHDVGTPQPMGTCAASSGLNSGLDGTLISPNDLD
jgi:hypothetical protein